MIICIISVIFLLCYNNMENNDDTCVIITGLVLDEYVDSLIKTYEKVENKIVVTWKDQNPHLLNKLKNNGFIILQNDYPDKRCSVNYQTRSIYSGIMTAKELGFKYVIRMRTDVFCNNFLSLMKKIRHLYIKNFTCICGQGYSNIDYFNDFCMASSIEDFMKMFYKEQTEEDNRYPELFWMETYFDRVNITPQDLKQNFNYFIQILEDNDIKMHWIKKKCDIVEDLKKNFRLVY